MKFSFPAEHFQQCNDVIMTKLLEDTDFTKRRLANLFIFIALFEFLDRDHLARFAMASLHNDTIGAFSNDSENFVVFHFWGGFAEERGVQAKKANGLDENDVRRYMYQLLRGVEYCHSHNVIHRDIKPENILISKNGALKLCDFGFARTMSIGGKYTDYVATRWYRAPELLVGDVEYGKGVDIWAIGCIFAEISNGIPLFPGESDLDQLAHIMRCFGKITNRMVQIFRRNPLFANVELPPQQVCEPLDDRFPGVFKSWITFLKACLKNDPDQRESSSGLMALPYFTEKNFRNEYENELKLIFEKEARQHGLRKQSDADRGGAVPPTVATASTHQPQTPTQYVGDQYAPALPQAGRSQGGGPPLGSSPVPGHPALGSLWSQYLASATTELPDLQKTSYGTKPSSQQGKYDGMMVTNGARLQSVVQPPPTQPMGGKKPTTMFPTLLQQQPSTPQQPQQAFGNSQLNGTLTGGKSGSDSMTSQLQYKKKPQKKNILSTLNLNSYNSATGGSDPAMSNAGNSSSQMMLFGHNSSSQLHGADLRRSVNGGKQW